MKTQTARAPESDHYRRILVVNAKGGCGKTTVATNLCAAYAVRGKAVALVDHDGQGSGAHWTAQRPADAPQVDLAGNGKLAPERIVIDGQPGNPGAADDELTAIADVILVPVLPSAIDIRAAERFITALMTRPRFRAAPRPIGVIANRVQHNTAAQARLMHFLGCLNVPLAATLRDSPLYGDAMGSGLGVADLFDVRAARREMTAWRTLLKWVEAQLPVRASHPRPLAAGRPSAEGGDGIPARAGSVLGNQRPIVVAQPRGPRPQRLSA